MAPCPGLVWDPQWVETREELQEVEFEFLALLVLLVLVELGT